MIVKAASFLSTLILATLFMGTWTVHAEGYSLIHSFNAATDGSAPFLAAEANLVISGTRLFGMTSSGGANDLGTIFSSEVDGSNFTVLHEFAGGANDGSSPFGSLTLSGSTLYGMTYAGGDSDAGTIFSLQTDGSSYSLIYEFDGTDGNNPYGSLTISGSTLYGMTKTGGNGSGNIFSIQVDGTGFTNLYSFYDSADEFAYEPAGSMLISGNTLYGMVPHGGTYDSGILFSIQTDGTNFNLLHQFGDGSEGYSPEGSLIMSGEVLLGMTSFGGSASSGTIFSIGVDGSSYQDIYSFQPATGSRPYGTPLLVNSTLYGVTRNGGANLLGTLFSVGLDGTGYTVLHNFGDQQSDGNSRGNVVYSNYQLLGGTPNGGANSVGTLFAYGLPAPSPSPSSAPQSSSTGGVPTYRPPGCTSEVPGMPNLFQINTTATSATLFYVPVTGPVNKYYISYGFNSQAEMFGVEYPQGFSPGVLSYTINNLYPNSTFFFKVRGGNGCMPGMWSNVMQIRTGMSPKTYYRY